MSVCVFCPDEIRPATPAVEFVGGLFDPDDPDFFVVDEGVMPVRYAHVKCLIEKSSAAQK